MISDIFSVETVWLEFVFIFINAIYKPLIEQNLLIKFHSIMHSSPQLSSVFVHFCWYSANNVLFSL